MVAQHEAEAVFLIGSHARGSARTDSDVNLLVFVDNDRLGSPRHVLEARREELPGFARPVTVLTVSLAEVGAGLYSGHAGWIRLAHEAVALHDPLDYQAIIANRLAAVPVNPEDPPAD